MSEKKFYDQGWNDYIDGAERPNRYSAAVDYYDGWHDAEHCSVNDPSLLSKMEDA
jgi:hypothetical protein